MELRLTFTRHLIRSRQGLGGKRPKKQKRKKYIKTIIFLTNMVLLENLSTPFTPFQLSFKFNFNFTSESSENNPATTQAFYSEHDDLYQSYLLLQKSSISNSSWLSIKISLSGGNFGCFLYGRNQYSIIKQISFN